MRSLKRILAIVLILAMTVSLGVGAFADPADEAKIDGAVLTSPVDPDPPLPNPGYDPKTKIDTNSQDYKQSGELITTVVSSKISSKGGTLYTVETKVKDKRVTVKTARNKNNKKVAIFAVGNGKDGIADSKAGRLLKKIKVQTEAKKLTVKSNALKGSQAKTLVFQSAGQVAISKDTFKGTKNKAPVIYIKGCQTANDVLLQNGAFNGLNEDATIIIKKDDMTKDEFKALKKKLVKYGFVGAIKYKK
jgi:hypothetical protein